MATRIEQFWQAKDALVAMPSTTPEDEYLRLNRKAEDAYNRLTRTEKVKVAAGIRH